MERKFLSYSRIVGFSFIGASRVVRFTVDRGIELFPIRLA